MDKNIKTSKKNSKYNKSKKENKSFISKFLFSITIKSLVVIILFLGSLIYIKMGDENKSNFKRVVYQNSLSFAKIYSVYKKYLGDVIPFKNIFKDNVKKVSNEKLSYESVKKENNGYVFTVSSDYAIPAIKSGIVIEVKKDNKYINVIKVQDKNGLNISYGYLNEVDVKLYDYIDKDEFIGKCNKKLYLIFEKDNKYLSYEEYL